MRGGTLFTPERAKRAIGVLRHSEDAEEWTGIEPPTHNAPDGKQWIVFNDNGKETFFLASVSLADSL